MSFLKNILKKILNFFKKEVIKEVEEKIEWKLDQVKKEFENEPVRVIESIVSDIPKYLKDDIPQSDEAIFNQTWNNTIKLEKVQPLRYYKPTTQADLKNIILEAENQGVMVRAVGKGHSFSDVANATDFLVDMLNVKKELDLETNTFKANTNTETLYRCEAGMMVEDLNENLDKKGLCIPCMAAFDQETIYGAIATSTHGTGIRVESMPEMVRSLDILAKNGKIYRLEPADGITDPTTFSASHPNITLLQDDDKFYSTVVGFGLMGIVYSVLLRVDKMYYMKQTLWMSTWTKVKPLLEDGSLFTMIDADGNQVKKDANGKYPTTRMQVFVNPYKLKSKWTSVEDNTCVVQVQVNITKEEFENDKSAESQKDSKIADFVEDILSNGQKGTHVATMKGLDKVNNIEDFSAEFLLHFLNKHPQMSPIINEIALLGVLSGSGKIGKGYVVMNQGKLAFKNAGYSAEPGFNIDNGDYLKGFDEILRTLAVSEKSDAYLTAPLCLRFTNKNKFYLSPEYNSTTCMIEIPMLIGTTGGKELLDRMQHNLIKFGARPHWGKICNMINGKDVVKQMYPKLETFVETVDYFNPDGTFDSIFSFRTGLRDLL